LWREYPAACYGWDETQKKELAEDEAQLTEDLPATLRVAMQAGTTGFARGSSCY